jgi:DNA (cytosine-5)-methyltransferase 1
VDSKRSRLCEESLDISTSSSTDLQTILTLPAPTIAGGKHWPNIVIEHDRDETNCMATRVMHHHDGQFKSAGNVLDKTCPTITSRNSYTLEQDHQPEMPPRQPAPDKPLYRVPSMVEIAAIPWNGLKVASTFSGCGGSCLGYRMAGFKIVWANEFVPAAQESYRANMSADAILDGRDIRLVQPEEILAATGLARGELDLFDGSPPCQAFSTAGKREKGWGTEKKYEHGAQQCNETLFDEFIRLLRGLEPKTFVAENVSGLVKGTAKGWFIDVLKSLKGSGYRVRARLLDAQWLGVPQMRQRIIFVGVREDLRLEPVHPEPLRYRYSVRDALPHLTACRTSAHGFTKESDLNLRSPAPSVTASGGAAYTGHQVQSAALPPGDVTELTGRVGGQFKRKKINLDGPLNTVQRSMQEKFEISGRAVHNTGGDSSYSAGDITDRPAPTITVGSESRAGGGSSNHFHVVDATEKRKFTIAELKRICAFPDDFVLIGTYAQQWERLGNSVPPLMMKAIAETIRDKVLAA